MVTAAREYLVHVWAAMVQNQPSQETESSLRAWKRLVIAGATAGFTLI
jgi:hypothetical protein